MLNEFKNIKKQEKSIKFNPKDNKMAMYNLKIEKDSNGLVSILVFLKAILYLFKLNLPTMFLKERYFVKIPNPLTSLTANYKFSTSSISSNNTSILSNEITKPDLNGCCTLKTDLAQNLHDLIEFIKSDIDDQNERNVYFEMIQMAFEYLSNI